MKSTILTKYEGNAESYKIPSGITTIEDNAFYDKGNLRKVIFPGSVVYIGDYAFKLCYKLKNIKLPERVEHFGIGVFQQCHNLESVHLPYGIEVIDSGMFVSCNSLKTLGIPSSVNSIEPGALAHCVNLESIYAPAEVFELVPNNKKLITAISYLEQIYYFDEQGRNAYITNGLNVFSYINENIKAVMTSIFNRKQEHLITDMVGYIEFGDREYSVILDSLMDEGRGDLSPAVIESRLISSKKSSISIFDEDPFA